jgi:hypothetical protein
LDPKSSPFRSAAGKLPNEVEIGQPNQTPKVKQEGFANQLTPPKVILSHQEDPTEGEA